VLHSFKEYWPGALPRYITRGYIVLKILLDFQLKNVYCLSSLDLSLVKNKQGIVWM
jgi:hypothetical protein